LNIWLNAVEDNDKSMFFNANFHQWMALNINGVIRGSNTDNWSSFWATACHAIWSWRNREYHDETFTRPIEPIPYLQKRVHDYFTACKANNVVSSISSAVRYVIITRLRDY
jgi:hypothetical protein